MTDRRRIRNILRIWTIICALVIIGGYAAFRAKNIAQGPEITIASPVSGAVSTEPTIEIKGDAANIARISLNGNKIFTDESGTFSERIVLSYGYNRVTLRAEDRFGRSTEKTLQLIYK